MLALRQARTDRGDHSSRLGLPRLRARRRTRAGRVASAAISGVDRPRGSTARRSVPPATGHPQSMLPRLRCAGGAGLRQRRCPRCELGYTLQQLRDNGDKHAVARLEPLLREFGQHDKPRSRLRWLEHSRAAPALSAMLRGELEISHQALDEHDVGAATAYLRSWLVRRHPRRSRGAPGPVRAMGANQTAGDRRASRSRAPRRLRALGAAARVCPQTSPRPRPAQQPPLPLRQAAHRRPADQLAAPGRARDLRPAPEPRRRMARRRPRSSGADPRIRLIGPTAPDLSRA